MRYISSIRDLEGNELDSFEYQLSDGFTHNLVIFDTDTMSKTDIDLTAGHNCIGRGLNFTASTGVVVRHTHKTACFQRYINMAETRHGVRPVEYRSSDVYEISDNRFKRQKDGNTVLEILFANDIISVYGQGGSVAVWGEGGEDHSDIMPLYDLFISLCRDTGLNLMQYETIQLGSRSMLWQTTIRLIQSAEAKRFYTKMQLDIDGKYIPMGCTGELPF